ncbi:alpha/beta hydrolase [Agarivorans sp. MS3-6]|uniref:alpha/beta hydrolase n=1 Tax=Agarivorans sp. TSD2052 TaxID=2937286 RepID=UPI00200D4DD1|nr:alpha/beta hydrolase [Agarivorans sp. TSD2052]UPW17371.1 alpha/beta hydrolase [Agarivorans sp. TSD2052]
MKENLSEVLFKPRINVVETSCVSNSLAAQSTADGQEDGRNWYRLLRREYWAWLGLDPIETEQLFANIAMSDKPRTSELLDTVAGYQPGNWNYEWTQRAVRHQTKAKKAGDEGDKDLAYKEFLNASYSATIAAYPHFKGDDIAATAQALAHGNFVSAMEHSDYVCKTIEIPIDGKKVSCYLHLPDTDSVKPVVLVSGGLDTIQTELYPLFERFLAPAGIAMLCIDLPGAGHCINWKLQQDSSRIHLAVLDYLPEVPWVDHARVAMLGYRFAGNVAARLAFIAPERLRAVVTIGSPVDRLFSDIQRFQSLPQMYKDCLANRSGVNAANTESLFYRCLPLSLKTQGILGGPKTQLPMFVVGRKNDPICPEADVSLLNMASPYGEVEMLREVDSLQNYNQIFTKVTLWLQKQL